MWQECKEDLIGQHETWGMVELGYRAPDDFDWSFEYEKKGSKSKDGKQGKIKLVSFKTFCPYHIDLDYYIRVNFTGFVSIIDTLGGVDVESEYSFTSQLDDSGYSYVAGTNHLSGEAALYFARERYSFTEGDRQRGRNQMAVIEAVLKKLMSSELLNNFSDLMSQMKDCFQTNMSKSELGKLVQDQLDDGGSWNIIQYSVTGTDSSSYCYSLGGEAYAMIPYTDTVDYATEIVKRVLKDEEITQSMIDNEAPKH